MDYKQLLALAYARPAEADFTAIRRAYPRTDSYNPYSAPVDLAPLKAAMDRQDWARAGMMCAEFLEADALYIELHLIMAHLFNQVGEPARARWHKTFADGLIRSIMDSGDGRSFQTAWHIVHIREEYDVLRLLQLTPAGRSLVEHEGRRYDVVQVPPQNSMYFDVEVLQAHLQQMAEGR